MISFRELIVRVVATLHPGRPDGDIEDELRSHLELAREAEERHGVNGARSAALRSGGLAASVDAMRDQRSLPFLEDFVRDVRHALRTIGRNGAFSAVVLVTIAIGIGATTAVFAVVNRVLIQPLPYPDADRLIAVWQTAPGAEGLTGASGDLRLSASMYFTYAEQNRTFEHLGIWFGNSATVTGVAEPERVRTVSVSDGTLQALGIAPLWGRSLTPADQLPTSSPTAILGYGYWQRRFGAERSVIGRRIDVDSQPYEIVGVMPRGFTIAGTDADLFLPARFDRSRLILAGFGFQGIGRLKQGVTLADASADIARLVPVWMRSWPAYRGVNPRVYEEWRIAPALRPLKQDVLGHIDRALWVLMLAMSIVLLIACANVATLLLVRTDGRQQELAIRAALGAGRGRIVRALIVESIVFSMGGGLAGLGLAWIAVHVLVAQGPATLPRLGEIAIDTRTVAFNLTLATLAGILLGLAPAWKYVSPRIWGALAGSGRTATGSRDRHRTRRILVVTQVALALVLLVVSGLMIRTFRAMHEVHPGFAQPEELQTLRTVVPVTLVRDPLRVERIQNEIVDKLTGIPGVQSAAFASEVAMEGEPFDWDVIEPEGRRSGAEVPPVRVFKSVSPRFFETMGTRLVAGRDYTWVDLYERRPVVIVSENVARQAWGTAAAALGKRVRTLRTAPWREVIGVAEDVYESGIDQPPPMIVYWPASGASRYEQGQITVTRAVTFVLRSTRPGTATLALEAEQAVWSVNPNLAVTLVGSVQQLYDRSMARTSFTLVLVTLAAGMALALGLIGIYGVIAYSVSQRRREIGIRLALGAQATELTRMFLRRGLALTALGLPIGIALSVVVARLMSSLLFGVSPLDPATYSCVPLVLVTAAGVASYLPARRAAAVDPGDVLRLE